MGEATGRARARGATLVALVALGGLGAWTFTHLNVATEITHFLPKSEDRELATIATEVSRSDLSRTLTLVVEAPDEDAAVEATQALAEALAEADEVAWVRSGPTEGMNEAFYSLYFERRLGFFTDRPDEVDLSDERLAARVHELKDRLRSPTGAFVRQIAPRDPLLSFVSHLEALRETQQGDLRVRDGVLLTEDGRGVIFLASESSPFDGEASRRLLSAIDDAFARVRRAHGGELTLRQSGVHAFAVRSEESIRADVTRISVVSGIGVVLLFLLLFRSPRYLLLGSVPLGAGFVAGLGLTQLLFGRIHGLSLAFGATLIGVAIDYVAHAVNHHTLVPSPDGPAGSLKKIWPGLLIGATTTIAGLAGLAWTSFPGIRELAVLTSVGVLVALLTTRYLLPPWMPEHPTPNAAHRRIADGLGRALSRLRGSPRALWLLPGLALAVSAVGLAQVRWVDDVRALNTLDPELLAEDERVREAVSRMDSGRFVIAWADDEEEALAANDEVYGRLVEAQEAGEVEAFRSLHSLLWSAALQRRSYEALASAPNLVGRLDAALEAEGFVPSGFDPFEDDLKRGPPEPLTYEMLQGSPMGDMVRSFRVDMSDGRVAFLTLTRGADPEALAQRLDGLEGVRVFDQAGFLQRAYGGFRARTLEMMLAGLVGVFLIVLARYRRLRLALAAFLPAVLAAACALATITLAGYDANLMHLVSLLLVLSMGVDYGVFMVESRTHEEGPAPTVVSLVIACASTVLSFGLLAMSDNPALRALGMVTGVGVLLSLLLAPTAWLLLASEGAAGSDDDRDGDADADAEAEAGAESDANADADEESDTETDAESDTNADTDADEEDTP